MIIRENDLDFITKALETASNIHSWSSIMDNPGSYNQSSKQGLNCIITWFWLNEAQHYGQSIQITRFPKLAIMKTFFNSEKSDIRVPYLKKALHYSTLSFTIFERKINYKIKENLSDDFFNFLIKDFDQNLIEKGIFNASSKLASLVEILKIGNISGFKKFSIIRELIKELFEFKKIPGFWKMIKMIPVFVDMSRVRHRIRFSGISMSMHFSDLAHMYETAIFEYLLSLSKGDNEVVATRHFFIGLFHDLAEAWTGDFPSPFKDSVPNFRKGTEYLEIYMLENFLFSRISNYQLDKLKFVMLEGTDCIDLKPLGKRADYFDASFECYRAIMAGNSIERIKQIFCQEMNCIDKYPLNFKHILIKWYYQIGAPYHSKYVEKINEIDNVPLYEQS